MNSRKPTVVTLDSLRNQFVVQEFNLEKANGSHLTLNRLVTLSLFAMLGACHLPQLRQSC